MRRSELPRGACCVRLVFTIVSTLFYRIYIDLQSLFFSRQVWFQNRRAKQRREEQQCIAVSTAQRKPITKSPTDVNHRLHTVEYLPWSCQSTMYHHRPTVQYTSPLDNIVPRWTDFYPYPSSLYQAYYKPSTSSSLMTPASSFANYRWPLELIEQHRAMIKQM